MNYYYNPENLDNNIALIKLAKPINFTGWEYSIVPICLPNANDVKDTSNCYTTGWGAQGQNRPNSKKLLQVNQLVNEKKQCEKIFPHLNDAQLCAGNTNRTVCLNDRGGPLQCMNKYGFWWLEGIVSFVPHDCTGPGLYSRIEAYVKWINDTIERNKYPKPNPFDPTAPPPHTPPPYSYF